MFVNRAVLSKKYPTIKETDFDLLINAFKKFDLNNSNTIEAKELDSLLQVLNVASPKELSIQNDTINFDEFLSIINKTRYSGNSNALDSLKKVIEIAGSSANITHTISEDEKAAFIQHINAYLGQDKFLQPRFPISADTMQLFQECKDGVLLAKLINTSVADTIDERALNISAKLSLFQMTENNNIVINSCKAIGCSVVNIGAQDIIEAREHLIFGLIWQIIRIGLLNKISLKHHPELFRLLQSGETLDDLMKLPADQILIRWVNYQLAKADCKRRIHNLSGDVKDSECYLVLLNQLDGKCSKRALSNSDLMTRANSVLENADLLGCNKYISAKAIVEGNQKLNLAFVANLFNTHPCLEELSIVEKTALDEWLFKSTGDREARAFALWINSLNIEPFVTSIYDDLRDGWILLQTLDRVRVGIVDWKKVNKAPISMVFKKVENCNYVIVLCKSIGFSLVGIQGSDIVDGNKTLTLAIVWQLMREHIVSILMSLSSGGKKISDANIIEWANSMIVNSGKTSKIASFKDSSLKSGFYFLELLDGLKKGVVDWKNVSHGENEDEWKSNGKYAISIARKLGATIFLLPEDIVEVKPKMIMTFVGSLMVFGMKK